MDRGSLPIINSMKKMSAREVKSGKAGMLLLRIIIEQIEKRTEQKIKIRTLLNLLIHGPQLFFFSPFFIVWIRINSSKAS
jgi:hypothetical protein